MSPPRLETVDGDRTVRRQSQGYLVGVVRHATHGANSRTHETLVEPDHVQALFAPVVDTH